MRLGWRNLDDLSGRCGRDLFALEIVLSLAGRLDIDRDRERARQRRMHAPGRLRLKLQVFFFQVVFGIGLENVGGFELRLGFLDFDAGQEFAHRWRRALAWLRAASPSALPCAHSAASGVSHTLPVLLAHLPGFMARTRYDAISK